MIRAKYLSLMFLGFAIGCSSSPTLVRPAGVARWSKPLTHDQRASQTEPPADKATDDAIVASDEIFAPASALVFDLPIARDLPPLNLDRGPRQPSAFVGFEGPSVEYHTVLIDNLQSVGYGGSSCGFGDGYQRQDFIQRTSVRFR